jgi:hypothetical protein
MHIKHFWVFVFGLSILECPWIDYKMEATAKKNKIVMGFTKLVPYIIIN